jgi:hypothetical protein
VNGGVNTVRSWRWINAAKFDRYAIDGMVVA